MINLAANRRRPGQTAPDTAGRLPWAPGGVRRRL